MAVTGQARLPKSLMRWLPIYIYIYCWWPLWEAQERGPRVDEQAGMPRGTEVTEPGRPALRAWGRGSSRDSCVLLRGDKHPRFP